MNSRVQIARVVLAVESLCVACAQVCPPRCTKVPAAVLQPGSLSEPPHPESCRLATHHPPVVPLCSLYLRFFRGDHAWLAERLEQGRRTTPALLQVRLSDDVLHHSIQLRTDAVVQRVMRVQPTQFPSAGSWR